MTEIRPGDGLEIGGCTILAGKTNHSPVEAYVQTAMREDPVLSVPNPMFHDVIDYHSTVVQTAQTAAKGRVGTLVLTHFVPAPPAGEEWAAAVGDHFDGALVAGPDLTFLELAPGTTRPSRGLACST